MFFGSFAWGANRYIRGMIRSYEAYQIKEKYVLKQWNDNEGRWQHMRLRPSSAYKYIEVHLSHGKECGYCTNLA